MEDVFSVKGVPWVSEDTINLKEYFGRYSKILEASPLQEDQHESLKEALQNCFPPQPQESKYNPFDVDLLKEACNPDLLTVKDELMQQDIMQRPAKHSGHISNWYAGTYKDTVIPAGGKESLHTLSELAKEHHRRETISEYATLRNCNFKYFNTVRMMLSDKELAEPTVVNQDECKKGLDDIILNVRIHRPFHKKLYTTKASNTFPKHSQELLVLGSQKLTALRDNIICINDLAVGKDLSAAPKLENIADYHNAAMEFPSGFLYINGVFYNDMRNPNAKDYSQVIKDWASKRSEIGPLESKNMEDTCFKDLELRLGYPYVFFHLGNCEHIIVFTDVRLHHKQDSYEVSRYPISWNQCTKLAAKCNICSLHLANWIVKGDSRLPLQYSQLCDRCLKAFCYDSHGKKEYTLKVYPFMDEFVQQKEKPYNYIR